MKKIDVCLSPDLIGLYDLSGKAVVVVDILRATSCITTALAHGVKSIIPVATLDEAREYKKKGYFIAGERNGQQVEGFDLGNSPFSYMDESLKGQSVVATTTNGTMALDKSRSAEQVIAGTFLNIESVKSYLVNGNSDVLIFCAGWKGKVNLEDTLYAGALVDELSDDFEPDCDAPLVASAVYKEAKTDMPGFLKNSSHVKRLHRLHIEKDIEFCLKRDEYDVLPILKGKELVKL